MDAGAGGAHIGDDLGVTRTIQHANGDLGRRDALGGGQGLDVVGGRLVQVDHPGRQPRAAGDLVHIGVGRIQQRALRRPGHHRQGVGLRLGRQGRAFQRIEGDVDLGPLPRADLLADVEHRRFIALAFADDDLAIDVQLVQGVTHRVDGGLVGGHLVATPQHRPRGDGGGFGHANGVQDQRAVQGVRTHPFLPAACKSAALFPMSPSVSGF